jgi:threonine dehydrogenase-like Zn-dependent dehydrogenase
VFVEPLACALQGKLRVGLHRSASVLVAGSGLAGILHVKLSRGLRSETHPGG